MADSAEKRGESAILPRIDGPRPAMPRRSIIWPHYPQFTKGWICCKENRGESGALGVGLWALGVKSLSRERWGGVFAGLLVAEATSPTGVSLKGPVRWSVWGEGASSVWGVAIFGLYGRYKRIDRYDMHDDGEKIGEDD